MSEMDLHIFTANLLRLSSADGVLYFHVPNGEYRSKRTGARLKAMGVLRGVADFAIVLPPFGQAAYLELKSTIGRQSPEQKAFEAACKASGAFYALASTPEMVADVLSDWGVIKQHPFVPVASKLKRAA